MAAANPQTEALEAWLSSNGAYLHSDIRILQDNESGVHLRATKPIPPATTIASTPHSMALSYLNALVDNAYPVFKQQRQRFKVEAIGYFYLMAQYINREQSFWKPYLEALPSPDGELTQALFFDSAEDIAWLDGTDVWHTVIARQNVYGGYYNHGIAVLQEAGIDCKPYTWHLFLWAVSMYTSRSFSSRTLRPQSGKYWAAYKSSSMNGSMRRQAVLLDMSSTPAEDLHFPVLFPGLDAANHSHESRVDWTFDLGVFTIKLAGAGEREGVAAGSEVFNNYGAKSNGELLIGYGFCTAQNENDIVSMTLKAPPQLLQEELRPFHPGFFNQQGNWNSEKATSDLKEPEVLSQTSSGLANRPQIFKQLPESLLELLTYVLRHERGLPFAFIAQPLSYLTDVDGSGRRYLPHIARMIATSLTPKLQTLQSTTPTTEPQNIKQHYASIYRNSQITITTTILAALKAYTRGLIYRAQKSSAAPVVPSGSNLFTLAAFTTFLDSHSLLPPAFLHGIAANAGTSDLAQLRLAGWEEDVWVLLLSNLLLEPDCLPGWLREALVPEGGARTASAEDVAHAAELSSIVEQAASACPGSAWANQGWSAEFVAATGGRMVKDESFLVRTRSPNSVHDANDAGGVGEEEEVGLFVHFYFP
ncbi:uncharacterized protein LTR77_001309 [Saxophila tyrrhenica]|uniref:SET domain-containing protein n=1 Tax=Saxophila tyrrhenica TaxID=1690608 RepID=A0AAV9PPM0_9PEZI|nr:hypothetical protein LTR77_001309 [Saxophila tyrrhenica]